MCNLSLQFCDVTVGCGLAAISSPMNDSRVLNNVAEEFVICGLTQLIKRRREEKPLLVLRVRNEVVAD